MEKQVQINEFLKNLQEKDYSGEWFFEQWSNQKTNPFFAFKQLFDAYMGLLIVNLRDYLGSQSFFNFNYKQKINRCIEVLEKERSMQTIIQERNDKRKSKMLKQQALNQLELQKKKQASSQASLDISPPLSQPQQIFSLPVIKQTLLSPRFSSQLKPQDYLSSQSIIGKPQKPQQEQQRSHAQKKISQMAIYQEVKTETIRYVGTTMKGNQHKITFINQDEGEDMNEETDFLIKKCQ